MKKLLFIFLVFISSCSATPLFADNTITDYSETSLPILNETLRYTDGRISTLEAAFGGSSVLPISGGGTGQTTAQAALNALVGTSAQGDILYYDGTNWSKLNHGISGQFLETQGSGANPQWTDITDITVSAGDSLVLYSGCFGTTGSSTYIKQLEVMVPYSGTYRISFGLRKLSAQDVYGKIYRNGVAVGTERGPIGWTWTEFSEDISGWTKGDLLQIYTTNKINTDGVHVGNLRVMADKGITPLPSFTYKVNTAFSTQMNGLGSTGDVMVTADGKIYVSSGGSWTEK